ncbi:MAG: glycosyltransferase [Flavobacteriales bacterium]|nr:glycosyltransferase [Flavobacteriales bacterium]
MRRKVIYVVSNVSDSKEYDQLIRYWDRERYELEFVLMNPFQECGLQDNIRNAGLPCTTLPYRGKLDIPRTVFKLMRLLRDRRPDVVHTNLLDAAFVGLLAAWLSGIRGRVNTRHHAMHNHKYHPIKGVLYDRILNALSTRIIAITHSNQEILIDKEGVQKEKVLMLHHGFDMEQARKDPARMAMLRERYADMLDGHGPIVGIISRPFDWKGLDHSIPALERIFDHYPDARVLLFNWRSTPFSDRYERMLGSLPKGSWRTIEFEPGVDQMFHLFDVFVHVPEDRFAEAFGLVYIEALLAGVPSIFTSSGIMHDLVDLPLKGVHMVPFQDRAAIENAVLQVLHSPPTMEDREKMAEANKHLLRPILDVRSRSERLYALYDEV